MEVPFVDRHNHFSHLGVSGDSMPTIASPRQSTTGRHEERVEEVRVDVVDSGLQHPVEVSVDYLVIEPDQRI